MILFPKKGETYYAVVDYWERWYVVEARIVRKEQKRRYRIVAMYQGSVMDAFGGIRRCDLFRTSHDAMMEIRRRDTYGEKRWRIRSGSRT